MNFTDTFEQLRELGSEQTRKTYRRHGAGDNLFGVSFADLGKLKKQFVGRGKARSLAHAVAQQLWPTQNLDAQMLATMIADPTQLSPADAEVWVADCCYHGLSDALASLLSQTSFAEAQMQELLASPQEQRQRLGYTMLSHQARQANARPDAYFVPHLASIEAHIHQAPNRAREAMNNCLIAIGSRSEALREQVEQAADRIGPVSIAHGDTACQTFGIKPYLARMWARKQPAQA
jgi:3-methyladenine DNA glycosylase AlkD